MSFRCRFQVCNQLTKFLLKLKLLNILLISFILLDEATQTKETTLMCALAQSGSAKLTMIGDPKQLGPCVNLEQDWEWISENERNETENALRCTLFHRLFDQSRKVVNSYK